MGSEVCGGEFDGEEGEGEDDDHSENDLQLVRVVLLHSIVILKDLLVRLHALALLLSRLPQHSQDVLLAGRRLLC